MSAGQTGYANNFGASLGGAGGRGVEGQILSCVFKSLITRLVNCMKEIKTQEHLVIISASAWVSRAYATGSTRTLRGSNKNWISSLLQALYCDVRQFVSYIKEAHGGVFRRVVLSALIDSAVRPHKKEPEPQTTRVIRYELQLNYKPKTKLQWNATLLVFSY
jgi:protein unc-80